MNLNTNSMKRLPQHVVFIGVNMDQDNIEATLDGALLTDEEMASGPAHWLLYEDPLPSWDPEQNSNQDDIA